MLLIGLAIDDMHNIVDRHEYGISKVYLPKSRPRIGSRPGGVNRVSAMASSVVRTG